MPNLRSALKDAIVERPDWCSYRRMIPTPTQVGGVLLSINGHKAPIGDLPLPLRATNISESAAQI
jgi:hypothetical protein